MPQTYFHCLPALLAPGSIIEPGNWGRIIRTYLPQDGGSFGVAFRETVLERERLAVAPHKPSRLSAVFACPTEAELTAFMTSAGRLRDVPYEVAPICEDVPLHFGDHGLPLLEQGRPYFDAFAERARVYWLAEAPATNIEVLIGGPVRIIKRL